MRTRDDRFKSVFITNQYFEDCLIIHVEPYDEVGYQTINGSDRVFDTFLQDLNKILIDNFDTINPKTNLIRINIHAETTPHQYILSKNSKTY